MFSLSINENAITLHALSNKVSQKTFSRL